MIAYRNKCHFCGRWLRYGIARLILVACVLLVTGSGGCGGGSMQEVLPGKMLDGAGDRTPPGAVYDFAASEDDGIVSLTWKTDWSPGLKGVLVRRSPYGWPENPDAPDSDSDRIVYSGVIHNYSDSGLEHRVAYYYSAFSFDGVPNYSEPVFASAVAVFRPYTFVVVPDTQYVALSYPALLNTMMQWAVDNRYGENIKFLLHEGDMTHTNSISEWNNVSASFGLLEGNVPYAFCPGNHDDTSGDTARMNAYLPVGRYDGTKTFGGTFEEGRMDNTWHSFSAGGTDWLVVALEYNPRDEVLEWVNGITASNPGKRVIVLTHAYLEIDGTRGSIGNRIWNNYVKLHENVIFVFNGHYTEADGARLVSEGDNGNKVYQMFANYQDLPLGGTGYMRLVRMDLDAKSVSVKTFSPFLNEFKKDDVNQFVFENVEFGPM